jgi:hypothetical protein
MRSGGRSTERHYVLRRGTENVRTLKAPRQNSSILLVKVFRKEGKVFGSEEDKTLGSGLCFWYRREIDLSIGRRALG